MTEKVISIPFSEYEEIVKERDELKEKLIEVGESLPSVVIDYGDIGLLESGRIISDRPSVMNNERFMRKNLTLARCPILSIKSSGDVGVEISEAIKQNEEHLKGMVEAIKQFKEVKSNSKATRRWWAY